MSVTFPNPCNCGSFEVKEVYCTLYRYPHIIECTQCGRKVSGLTENNAAKNWNKSINKNGVNQDDQ